MSEALVWTLWTCRKIKAKERFLWIYTRLHKKQICIRFVHIKIPGEPDSQTSRSKTDHVKALAHSQIHPIWWKISSQSLCQNLNDIYNEIVHFRRNIVIVHWAVLKRAKVRWRSGCNNLKLVLFWTRLLW